MKAENVAKVYAKSLMGLGKQRNLDVARELTLFTELINSSNDLENCLFLDIFDVTEKESVLVALTEKLGLSSLIQDFLKFMIREKRINIFPLVFKEVIVLDDHEKGFMRGTIEGVHENVSSFEKDSIYQYLKKLLNKEPILEYRKSGQISAGYKITAEDLQLDASLDTQLQKFKDSIFGELK